MNILPIETIDLIYEYDGRYKKIYDTILKELDLLIFKYTYEREMISESIGMYYNVIELPTEDKEYYVNVINTSFYNYFLKNWDI